MSIYRRMLARELPVTLRQLLAIEPKLLAAKQLENFQRRAELQTGDIQVLHRLGLSSIAAEHWGKAIHYLTSVVEIHPSHIPSRLALALAYEGLSQHAHAAGQLGEILAMNPITSAVDTDTILTASGLCWERAGNLRLAMNRFATNRLVAIHLSAGHLSAAALRLSRGLDYRPTDLGARICLGHVLQLAGRHDEAATEYEKALRLEPESAMPTLELAKTMELIENGTEAIGLLKKLLLARPD